MENDQILSDYEEVVKLFPEPIQRSLKENPYALQYLTELSSAGLQRLHQEPERLADEKTLIQEQTQDLAFHNYKTFIQTAECSHEIFQDYNIIGTRLQSMLDKLPKFNEKCLEFCQNSETIHTRWREASLTLKKHPQLLELLEVPQLMESYVRNSLYEEALELALYVKRLDRKHSSIPLIAGIVENVQDMLNCMLLQLLEQLKSNIQLPACLKVIGFLRRMDVFSELELRMKFLQARGAWLQELIDGINSEDPYKHIIKVVEVSRIHMFDIVTQYRAIFSDDDPILLAAKDGGQSETSIFQCWVSLRISNFLAMLQKDLSNDIGDRIDSVFSQCMYFGLSFSRVGIDFRPLVIPMFEKFVLAKFAFSVSSASALFEKAMEAYTLTNYSITTATSTSMTSSVLSGDSLQPPNGLLDFPPLADYCNNVLMALNNLKLCCSFGILSDVVSYLDNSLRFAVITILDYESTEKANMTKEEYETFVKFCIQFSNELVPHFGKCLAAIFPPDELYKIFGVTPLEFSKFSKSFVLDIDAIVKPLEDILPMKDDVGIMITIKEEIKDDVTVKDIDETVAQTSVETNEENTKDTSDDGADVLKGNVRDTAETVTEMPAKTNEENSKDITNDDSVGDTAESVAQTPMETHENTKDTSNDGAGVLKDSVQDTAETVVPTSLEMSEENCKDPSNKNANVTTSQHEATDYAN